MAKVGRRRKAREVALQFLYELDVHGVEDPASREADFWAEHATGSDTKSYARTLVLGTKANQATIDRLLGEITEHWDVERMAVVDRNILRLAVYELGWQRDVPPKVAINEAIEIAKKFGTGESARFINGVLDRAGKELRPAS